MSSSCNASISPLNTNVVNPNGSSSSSSTLSPQAPAVSAPSTNAHSPLEMEVEEGEHRGVQHDSEGEEADAPQVPEPHADARPERQRLRALRKPVAPTRLQREAHEVSHVKFEPWCEHCLKGKGLNDPHRKLKRHVNDEVTPVVSMDFAFSKLEGQEGTSPVLVLRDHLTRVTFAHPVPGKSTANEPYSRYTVDKVINI